MSENIWLLLLSAFEAYLLGGILFAYILAKLLKQTDLRTVGSGNAGSTNMLRNFGGGLAAVSLIGDIAKGVLAVYLGKLIGGNLGMHLAAVFVVMGHNWPVFMNFKGGKGVATTVGVLVYLMPVPMLAILAFAITLIWVTRIVSVGSMAGALLACIAAFVCYPSDVYLHITVIILSLILIVQHRENIRRLIQGKENKLGFKKTESA